MLKKILIIIISLLLILPAVVPVFSVFSAQETRVCGVDKKNYPNIKEANKLGAEVSYKFPCQFPKSENGLFERSEDFEFTGMLFDFFSDKDFIQLFIKDNFDKQNYFVVSNILNKQELEKYLPGDQIKIKGLLNANTKVVKAREIKNISQQNLNTYNCKIEEKDQINKSLYCNNKDAIFVLNYGDQSKFVSGFVNPASIDDFETGDFVRVRVNKNKEIKTLILSERGNLKYLKNHIFKLNAQVNSIDIQNNFLELKIDKYPNAINDIDFDKNNFNIKLKISKNTRIVKKYFGKLNLKDFKIGDNLYIIGRANDNGSFEAITIKNNSVWK